MYDIENRRNRGRLLVTDNREDCPLKDRKRRRMMRPSWIVLFFVLLSELVNIPKLPLRMQVCGALQILLTLPMIWLGAVAVLGLTRRRKSFPLVRKQNRFAIVVCARNEEKALPSLLESIRRADYPSGALHVFLLADHCTDRTAAIGRRYPFVTVYERQSGPTTGKGAVLNWGIPRIYREYGDTFDAAAVFDADNVIRRDFFTQINAQLNAGDEIIQGNRLGGKPYTSLITRWYTLYWSCYSTFFSYAREKLGLSAFLTGTGFVVTKSVLENGWHTKSITEDVEFTIQNCLQGRRTAFCVSAVCYDEQPWQVGVMFSQLSRWCTGSYQILRRYLAEFFRNRTEKRKLTGRDVLIRIDVLMLLVMGPVSWMGFVLTLVNGFFMWKYWQVIFWLSLIISGLGLLAAFVPIAGAAKFNRIEIRTMLPAIITFPVFMFFYMICSIRACFFPALGWKKIEHKALDVQ